MLQTASDSSNAKLAADVYLEDADLGFSRLDGSFTIVYYSNDKCGIVRDHHGTHYPVYYTSDGMFATSWVYLKECEEGNFRFDPVSLSHFLQRGIMDERRFVVSGIRRLNAGEHVKMDLHESLVLDKVVKHTVKVIEEENPNVEVYSRRYGELHEQAIRRRIGNSRRVGILLSGGYDSGSNLAALRTVYDGEIDSYSIGFKGDDLSLIHI